MSTINYGRFPRADTTTIEPNHNQWALHAFAFDYDTKPPRFRNYHSNKNRDPGPGYYDEYIPVAYECDNGQILKKKVIHRTRSCPDCDVAARKVNGDTLCPECGLIVHESVEMVRDGKATGRTNGDKSQ
jgi:hypothetical protein